MISIPPPHPAFSLFYIVADAFIWGLVVRRPAGYQTPAKESFYLKIFFLDVVECGGSVLSRTKDLSCLEKGFPAM